MEEEICCCGFCSKRYPITIHNHLTLYRYSDGDVEIRNPIHEHICDECAERFVALKEAIIAKRNEELKLQKVAQLEAEARTKNTGGGALL